MDDNTDREFAQMMVVYTPTDVLNITKDQLKTAGALVMVDGNVHINERNIINSLS